MSYDNLNPVMGSASETSMTKRKTLRHLSEIWDPLGMWAGIVITGKLLFQSIVRLKLEWDQVINDEEVLKKWESWREELLKCKDLVVARSIFPSKEYSGENLKPELVGFSDGSSVAYGCVLYLKWKNADEH